MSGRNAASFIKAAARIKQQVQALYDLKEACADDLELYQRYYKLYLIRMAICVGSFIVIVGGMFLFIMFYPYKNANGGIDFPISLYMILICLAGFIISAGIANNTHSFF